MRPSWLWADGTGWPHRRVCSRHMVVSDTVTVTAGEGHSGLAGLWSCGRGRCRLSGSLDPPLAGVCGAGCGVAWPAMQGHRLCAPLLAQGCAITTPHPVHVAASLRNRALQRWLLCWLCRALGWWLESGQSPPLGPSSLAADPFSPSQQAYAEAPGGTAQAISGPPTAVGSLVVSCPRGWCSAEGAFRLRRNSLGNAAAQQSQESLV